MRSAFTILRGAVVTGAVALGLPAAAFAAASGTGESTPLNLTSTAAHHTSSSVGGGSILRTILALVIVIGLIYGIARVLKAVKGGGGQRASGDGLEHLATLPLAQGRSVALVRSGSDVVLVGISESGVTPIKVYTEAEALMNGIALPPADSAAPALIEAGEGRPGQNFIDILRRMTVRV
jgi:flagellar protein FliO/FliZ